MTQLLVARLLTFYLKMWGLWVLPSLLVTPLCLWFSTSEGTLTTKHLVPQRGCTESSSHTKTPGDSTCDRAENSRAPGKSPKAEEREAKSPFLTSSYCPRRFHQSTYQNYDCFHKSSVSNSTMRVRTKSVSLVSGFTGPAEHKGFNKYLLN